MTKKIWETIKTWKEYKETVWLYNKYLTTIQYINMNMIKSGKIYFVSYRKAQPCLNNKQTKFDLTDGVKSNISQYECQMCHIKLLWLWYVWRKIQLYSLLVLQFKTILEINYRYMLTLGRRDKIMINLEAIRTIRLIMDYSDLFPDKYHARLENKLLHSINKFSSIYDRTNLVNICPKTT